MAYEFYKVEKKWQKKWEEKKIFEIKEDKKKKKFYVLEMFPYPSSSGLHMGHALNYTIGDIYARFKRMNGFNVFYPMGYDAFGLPAENAAIKAGEHPKKYTENSMKNFAKQQKSLGLSYDWSRIVVTCSPEYYKWNQYFFLKFFEKGLVYRKKSPVNFCEKCNTVLANEQVHNGKCWRHEHTEVQIKHLEQWFIKTTKYSEELLKDIPKLQWPERIKLMQENWIGKSHGTEVKFEIIKTESFGDDQKSKNKKKISDINGKKWPIFTTRPDTIYGVTFMVVSAQHEKLMELVTDKQKKDVEKFLKKLKSVSEKELEAMEKEGVFTGSYAINPLTKEKVPVYAGNFVIADYGSGMVMAVPAHDQRDFEFAKKYKINIREVIIPVYGEEHKNEEFRNSISAVIHRKKDNKFLLLNWKNFGWVSPIVGGVEKNEDIKIASEREVLEETGYKAKFVKKLLGLIEAHYFADNKKIWRGRCDQPVLLELIDDKAKGVDKKEKEMHEAVWMSAEEALQKISHDYNKLGIKRYLEGERAYTGEGKLINSGEFNGLNSKDAIEQITKYLEKKKLGKRTINYKLRDWLVSRQRYWGTPIPIIYCDKCGIVPVPEEELPVLLPEKIKFGKGNPLKTNKEFVNVKCPKCGKQGKRETDTMDTFFDSSWYFLRYCDSKNNKMPFDKKKTEYWMPVDQYIGGAEHACMHLIYARFFIKALRDMGMLRFDEPFTKLFNQGMLHGTDGNKMSKSLGNVINPIESSEKYGADSLRLALMSFASPDKDTNWDENVLMGSFKFIDKIFNYFNCVKISKKTDAKTESKLNKTIKEVGLDIEDFKYNLAIIKIRGLFEALPGEINKEVLEKFLKLLHPFCPHITEEFWEKLGNKGFVSLSDWPKAGKIDERLLKQDKMIEDLIKDINNILKILAVRGEKKAIVKVFAIPNEVDVYSKEKEQIKKRVNLDVKLFSIKEAISEGKTVKAKPGKPGILIE